MNKPLRTVAAEHADFEAHYDLNCLPKRERDLLRLNFYGGAVSMYVLIAQLLSKDSSNEQYQEGMKRLRDEIMRGFKENPALERSGRSAAKN